MSEYSASLALGCVAFMAAVFSAVMTGVGWHVLNSSDVCDGSMHDFITGITISATVQLAVFGFGFVMTVLATMFGEMITYISVVYNGIALTLAAICGALLNIVFFVWGIVVLSNDECPKTSYRTMSIVMVVLCGISLCNNLFTCNVKTNRSLVTRLAPSDDYLVD